jgi:hypothetical protein
VTTTIRLRVVINGTSENRWHRYRLQRNPFPQLGHVEWHAAEMMVASLDGDPITSEQDIRDRLPGFSPEFVELCCARYVPGERVAFLVCWKVDDGNVE